ncbi:MAG: DUF2970 domain-containing protein [Gammaproteobacteria bacterium]
MSPWKVVKSVLSAMLGVRPAQAAEEDFAGQKIWPFVVVGIIFVVLFVATLVIVVQVVLS